MLPLEKSCLPECPAALDLDMYDRKTNETDPVNATRQFLRACQEWLEQEKWNSLVKLRFLWLWNFLRFSGNGVSFRQSG